MPFIRHLRDKRGYETTLVMHAYRPQQGPQRTRVLYLFRSPSSVKMGRQPLDEEIREALEHTHPDVSFDWMGLDRESAAMRREEHRERDRDRDRGPRQRQQARSGQRPTPEPVRVVVEDDSMLGRTLGGEAAANLRRQYAELVQRIARRSRTPEERDRLGERAQRLNPDDWPDEDVIRAMAATADADRLAIANELPARRRGRRAGRRRDREGGADLARLGGDGQAGLVGAETADRGIMAGDGDSDEDRDPSESDGVDAVASDREFDDPVGPEPAGDGPTGNGFSDDDQRGSD